MKACIYIRVSTQRQQISGLGLEAQREICMNYIKQSGKEYVTELFLYLNYFCYLCAKHATPTA